MLRFFGRGVHTAKELERPEKGRTELNRCDGLGAGRLPGAAAARQRGAAAVASIEGQGTRHIEADRKDDRLWQCTLDGVPPALLLPPPPQRGGDDEFWL